jgi:hypothetical protein
MSNRLHFQYIKIFLLQIKAYLGELEFDRYGLGVGDALDEP